MSAHARLRGYGVAREIGRRLAADPAVRAALRAVRAARLDSVRAQRRGVGEDIETAEVAYAVAGRAASDAARPHLPPGLSASAIYTTVATGVVALWSLDGQDPGWDLHARALERGDVVLLPAPDGSGEVVGI